MVKLHVLKDMFIQYAFTVYAGGGATLFFAASDLVAGHSAAVDLDTEGVLNCLRLEG